MRLESFDKNKLYFAIIILPQLWMYAWCQTVPEPYSIQVDSSISVQEGLCVIIPCAFTADHKTTFKNSTGYWKSNYETNIASSNASVPIVKENFHVMGNPDNGDCTLKVTDARKQDTGTYFFRFEGSKETSIKYNYVSDKITLLVTDPPSINTFIGPSGIIANHTVVLNEGDSVTLNCSVISNPAAYVTWAKGENNVVSSVTGQGLELYLMDVTSRDINTYSCSAWNQHGDTSDFVDIILQSKNEDREVKLSFETSPTPAPEIVTAFSPQCGPRNIDFLILGAFIAANILILSLIALALLCFVRRNMKKRQEAIINNGEELSTLRTASVYKNLNE
ncbi:sialic acid-binding Ig-like lectin 14 isoform X4 [Bufo bufo]|uniref:sialic acid-binding Ig-like lectin 14 isoform X4 n=1 Tax=Bufo bufo TaxID=8384 RepID=UPI001ABDCD83|nr:sialic acid-binding Ig-like lectin 14 isoform X4 [Bufo bufo]